MNAADLGIPSLRPGPHDHLADLSILAPAVGLFIVAAATRPITCL